MTGPSLHRLAVAGTALSRALAWFRDTLTAAYDPRTFLNGIRIVILAGIPFMAGLMAHSPQAGLLGGLGAMAVGFCDLPGSYRRRAAGLAATAILLGLMAGIGTALHGLHPWSLAILLLLGTLLGFTGTLTATAGKATTFALVMLILGDGLGGQPGIALEHGAAALLGGLWMTFGILMAWPLQPFGPARRAVRQAFEELARVLDTAAGGLSIPRPDGIVQAQAGWQARYAAHQALDAALSMLTDLRAIRDGTSMTGRRLVLALQQGRLVAMSVAGLSQGLEMVPPAARPLLDPAVADLLGGMSRDIARLGEALVPNVTVMRAAPLEVTASGIAARLAAVEDELARSGIDAGADMDGIAFYLLNLRAEIARARESLAGSLEDGDPEAATDLRPAPLLQSLLGADPGHVLLDNLSLKSQRLRHGLRVGVILAVATFAYTFMEIAHGYWIPLVAVVVLKPGYGGTRAAGIARTVGTVIGGLIAAVLLALFHGTLAHALLALAFATCAFGVISRNLGLGTVLLTPFIVMLLAIMAPQDSDVIWLLRIGDTMIGAAMAFIGLLTLWPGSERERVPHLAADTLRKHAALTRLLLQRMTDPRIPRSEVRARRRAVTLAMSELDACWEQLLSEPRQWHPQRDRYYTLVSLVRLSLVQSGPLFTVPAERMTPAAQEKARILADDLTRLQEEVAEALAEGAALPDIAMRTRNLRIEVRALEQQDAAARANGRDGAGAGPGAGGPGGDAETALYLVTGCLARLAETSVNLAQVTERLRNLDEPPEPPPRFRPDGAATPVP